MSITLEDQEISLNDVLLVHPSFIEGRYSVALREGREVVISTSIYQGIKEVILNYKPDTPYYEVFDNFLVRTRDLTSVCPGEKSSMLDFTFGYKTVTTTCTKKEKKQLKKFFKNYLVDRYEDSSSSDSYGSHSSVGDFFRSVAGKIHNPFKARVIVLEGHCDY
jgi:hypothetical protein